VPGTQWWLLGYGPGVAQPDPDHMLLCIHHHSSSAAAAAMPADAWGPGFSSHGLGPSSDPGGWLVSGAHQGLKQLHHNLELASHSPAARTPCVRSPDFHMHHLEPHQGIQWLQALQ